MEINDFYAFFTAFLVAVNLIGVKPTQYCIHRACVASFCICMALPVFARVNVRININAYKRGRGTFQNWLQLHLSVVSVNC